MQFRFSPPFQRIFTLSLIVYIALIGGTVYGKNNIFLLGLQHTLLTMTIIGWLLALLWGQRPFPKTPFDVPLLIYVIWLLFTTFFTSHDWRVSLEEVWLMLVHVISFYILVDLMQQGRQRWVFEGLFLVGALAVVLSILEISSWYGGVGFGGYHQGWFSIGGLHNPIPPKSYRLSLAFNISTWLGSFVMQLLPLLIAWILTVHRKVDRQVLTMILVGLVWVLVFSASRGAMLGLIVAAGVMGGLYLFQRGDLRETFRQKWFYSVLSAIAAILLSMGGFIFWLSVGRASGDQGRVALWQGAIEMIEDKPLFGTGVHLYPYFLREHISLTTTNQHHDNAHNLYLNTVAEIGILGGLLLLWLGGIFLITFQERWKSASPAKRIRLNAALGLLAGFCTHSLVETFTYTAMVMPMLSAAAYVTVGEYKHHMPASQRNRVYRSLPQVILILVISFYVWILRIDVAQFRLAQGIVATVNNDYDLAREKVEAARSLDPHLRLYDLQDAYLLGLLANQNPDDYLGAAIEAHQNVLVTDPSFDIGHSNLAALYAQQGDYENALAAAERASALRSDLWLYQFKVGEYQEALGLDDAAVQSYKNALTLSPLVNSETRDYSIILAASAYWDEANPVHQQAFDIVFEEYTLSQKLILAIRRGWEDRAAEVANQLESNANSEKDYAALGFYAAWRGDLQGAVAWYEQAESLAWVQVELAKVHLELGDTESAEKAARTALFLKKIVAFPANYTLAQLRMMDGTVDDKNVDRLLVNAVKPRYFTHSYSDVVFAHLAWLDYLPQVHIPGSGEASFEPWFLLAERYAADNDKDTNPINVYKAILDTDPYVERARELCGIECQ